MAMGSLRNPTAGRGGGGGQRTCDEHDNDNYDDNDDADDDEEDDKDRYIVITICTRRDVFIFVVATSNSMTAIGRVHY
eukprot:1748932-Pyramimonas_sp.AAC.1